MQCHLAGRHEIMDVEVSRTAGKAPSGWHVCFVRI